jgi:DNA-binding winged helix-turn-helix (wHTH) protein
MDTASEAPASVAFGRFRVLPHRRELLADGRPIKLGGRAFDVLMALIEARGAVIGKDALMARVWSGRIVEENNLQAQISALRAAFGAERKLIRTVPRRGYQFTGEIRILQANPDESAGAGEAAAEPQSPLPPTNLPEPISELIGRDDELREILSLAAAHRLVTLTGPGGIGKTRLGSEVAHRLLPNFVDGVWAIELAPLSDPELVPVAVATALGLELTSGTASPLSVARALRSKQLMLVLDNCEHVVEAVAQMAEALLRADPAARVIVTSREPLRAEGEWVYPVPPLAVPAEGSPDSEEPFRYGAIRLFVERARAAAPHFSPEARVAAAIVGICRRLDGIPLAIELAAARMATLGIEELAARLDDRFWLLTGGHRTAMPRHQTLRATLDWSYELLTEPERVVLRRLAIFPSGFTLPAASAVATDDEIAASDVVDCVPEIARDRGRWRRDGPLSVARNDSGLFAREARTGWRVRGGGATPCQTLSGSFRRRRGRSRDAANGRMVGRLRLDNRQFARGARLGVFAGRRRLDRRGADCRRRSIVDSPVAGGRVPIPRGAGACQCGTAGRSRQTP